MPPVIHHRRSSRLRGYDYSLPGAYFVTIVTKNRMNLFGMITDGEMIYSHIGEIIRSVWLNLPNFFQLRLGEWVLMPNHMHGIIWILDASKGEASADSEGIFQQPWIADASPRHQPMGTQSGSLGAIIQNFKSISSRKIKKYSQNQYQHIWQRNYYDHIIRNESELERISLYIADNPRTWTEDDEYAIH